MPTEIRHGTVRAYKAGCHCEDCRSAARDEKARHRARNDKPEPRVPWRSVSWQERAACIGMEQEGVFFNGSGSGYHDGEQGLPGLAVCASCAVTSECLQYALDLKIEVGIFGAMTARQRWNLTHGREVSALRALPAVDTAAGTEEEPGRRR